MHTTLKERVLAAMAGPPVVRGKDLAAYCGCSGASVSDWRSGKTKSIEGQNLVRAADFLRVRTKWLAEGIGPMRDNDDTSHHHNKAEEATVQYMASKPDPMVAELLALFAKLDKRGKSECLIFVRVFVNGRASQTDAKIYRWPAHRMPDPCRQQKHTPTRQEQSLVNTAPMQPVGGVVKDGYE